jgi:hypothetical protein
MSDGAPKQPSAPSAGTRVPPMSPGDEAPPGTPGTGENVCRRCAGRGQVNGQRCPDCEGSGRVISGIGGA